MSPTIENGGFPDPPPGEPVRVVSCSHLACGAETRIRLPSSVPTGVVRRVVCAGCATAYETATVEELGPQRRRWLDTPPGRLWTLIAIPIAAIAVFGVVVLINAIGSDEGESTRGGSASSGATFVKRPGFSLALPSEWRREAPTGGASFRAASDDGTGDAVLLVTRDPSLSLPEFERRSRARLRARAGEARVENRITGPTAEKSVVRLRARSATTGTSYEVSLRESGPYRYYLSTSLRRDASRQAVAGARLIQSSFSPEGSTATATGAR